MSVIRFQNLDGIEFTFSNLIYSELIKAMEPDEDNVIKLFENYSEIEIEEAKNKYEKYVKFKEIIEKIRSDKNSWKHPDEIIDRLREGCVYDFNNSLLNWLMIKETDEDKSFKNLFIKFTLYDRNKLDYHYYGHELEYIKIRSDNISLYWIVDLLRGRREYNFKTVNVFTFNVLMAMINGHIGVCKELKELDYIDFDIVFKYTCISGKMDIMNWIYSSCELNLEKIYDDIFYRVFFTKNIKVIDWFYNLDKKRGKVNLEKLIEIGYNKLDGNDLAILIWIYSKKPLELEKLLRIGKVNLDKINEKFFLEWICEVYE